MLFIHINKGGTTLTNKVVHIMVYLAAKVVGAPTAVLVLLMDKTICPQGCRIDGMEAKEITTIHSTCLADSSSLLLGAYSSTQTHP